MILITTEKDIVNHMMDAVNHIIDITSKEMFIEINLITIPPKEEHKKKSNKHDKRWFDEILID